MKNITKLIVLLTLSFISISAFSQSYYVDPSQVNSVRDVQIGRIVGLKYVHVDESNFVRTAVGGGIGYAIGNQIGNGRGRTVSRIAGALIGMRVAKKTSPATEITVQLNNGRYISVIQKGTWHFKPNERVKVMYGNQNGKNVAYVDTMY